MVLRIFFVYEYVICGDIELCGKKIISIFVSVINLIYLSHG